MIPIIGHIGPFPIYTYGLLSAAALGVSVFLASRRAAHFGWRSSHTVDAVFLLFITGMVGSRLFFVVQNWELYAGSPFKIFDFREGGLVWYGGFLLAFAAAFLIVHFFGWDRWAFADFIPPVLAAGHALGRVGCFLNGCCAGIHHQPVQLYEAFFLGGLAFYLWKKTGKVSREGDLFLLYVLLYSAGRFVLEFLRADQTRYFFLTVPQMTGLILFGITLSVWMMRHGPRKV